MSEQQASVQIAETVLNRFDGYMIAAQNVIEQYGGDAVDLGLVALRVDAASGLVLGFIFLLSIYPICIILKIAAKAEKRDIGGVMLTTLFGGGAALVWSAVGLSSLFNIWSWVGIFYPEVYAVHKFLM